MIDSSALCRIVKSNIALNKFQFDALLVHVSRGSSGTVEPISEVAEVHDAESNVQETTTADCEAEVSNVAVQTSPAAVARETMTPIDEAGSSLGVHFDIFDTHF